MDLPEPATAVSSAYPGVKNECADYISRNNFDDIVGSRSEELAKEAVSRMAVHVDLNMTMIRPLYGLKQVEYLKEFGDIYKRLERRLEPVLVNQEPWKRDKTYLWHEDQIGVRSNRIPALLKWTNGSSGHVGADRTLKLFKQWFHSTWSDDQLRKTLQPIVDKARGGPANQGISGTEVSFRPFLSHSVPTAFSMWTTRRCPSLGAMILP